MRPESLSVKKAIEGDKENMLLWFALVWKGECHSDVPTLCSYQKRTNKALSIKRKYA